MKRVLAIILTLALLFTLSSAVFAASSPSSSPSGDSSPSSRGDDYTGSSDTDKNKTVTQTLSDGTKVTTTTSEVDGITIKEVTVTTPDGETSERIEITVPSDYKPAVPGKITLPVSVEDSDSTTITADFPENESFKLEIPVTGATKTTVAVRMNEDGTETVVMRTLQTDEGIVFPAEDGATYVIKDNKKNFVDDNGWYKNNIAFVSSRNIVIGTGDTTFAPKSSVTRGMVFTVLARISGETVSATGDQWYSEGMQWAINAGVSDGTNPTSMITREQMVTMLYRSVGSPEVSYSLASFTDADSVSDYANAAMQWAVSIGLIKGMGDGTLNPKGDTTRGQLAAIIERFITICG